MFGISKGFNQLLDAFKTVSFILPNNNVGIWLAVSATMILSRV